MSGFKEIIVYQVVKEIKVCQVVKEIIVCQVVKEIMRMLKAQVCSVCQIKVYVESVNIKYCILGD